MNKSLELLEKREALLNKKISDELNKAREFTKKKNKRGMNFKNIKFNIK